MQLLNFISETFMPTVLFWYFIAEELIKPTGNKRYKEKFLELSLSLSVVT